MAGTVTREPAATSVVAVSQSRANAEVRVNRSTDRLSQLSRAKKLAAQQAAARKAALKRAAAKKAAAQQARATAAKRAAAKKAAAQQSRATAAKRAAAKKAAAKKARIAAAKRAAAKRASRSAIRSIAPNTGSNRRIGREMAAKRGWTGDQWTCLNNLWTKESGWSSRATNASGSAGGIPQALPASKMASAGDDWRTNPATQIKWGLRYISGRYGNPCGAWRHFQNRNWY
jgi:membrane protein involved in colicin uptake